MNTLKTFAKEVAHEFYDLFPGQEADGISSGMGFSLGQESHPPQGIALGDASSSGGWNTPQRSVEGMLPDDPGGFSGHALSPGRFQPTVHGVELFRPQETTGTGFRETKGISGMNGGLKPGDPVRGGFFYDATLFGKNVSGQWSVFPAARSSGRGLLDDHTLKSREAGATDGQPSWGLADNASRELRKITPSGGIAFDVRAFAPQSAEGVEFRVGQVGGESGKDAFEPSGNSFVTSYEAGEAKRNKAGSRVDSITKALFRPGGVGAGGVESVLEEGTPTKGDAMIASYVAAQGVQSHSEGEHPDGGGAGDAGAEGGLARNVKGKPARPDQEGVSPQQQRPLSERFPMRPDLGESVKRWESGKDGICSVSTGRGDPGGVSYGSYQLSTNAGTMQDFLKSPEGKQYAGEFKGLTPGTKEFTEKWKEIASLGPEDFHKAEKAFIYRTRYLPRAKAAAELGFDMSNPAIQDAVWSGSIQHKGFVKVMEDAANSDPYFRYRSAEKQLKALYEARSNYTDRIAGLKKSAGRLRYEQELPSVIARNQAYQEVRRR